MKLKAIIIDDNQASINILKKMLDDFFSDVEIIGSFKAVASSISAIENDCPDIVFLDVEIPKEDGFQLFKYIPQPDFETIFITAYKDYAAEAFRVDPIDYLIKPINPSELKIAIERVKAKKQNTKKINASPKSKLAIQTKTGIEFLEIDEIYYCQALDNYTMIFTQDNKKLVSKPLKKFEEILSGAGFFRTSRSYLVNIKFIKSITLGKKSFVLLNNDAEVPVSQSNKQSLIDLINTDQAHSL